MGGAPGEPGSAPKPPVCQPGRGRRRASAAAIVHLMASAPAAKPRVSYAEYLAAEEKSTVKHEWLDGVVYDLEAQRMAGGTPERAALTAAVTAMLVVQLHGKPCRVFSSDLRVRIAATGLSTYADAAVVCTKLETSGEDKNAVTNPVLVVEVLSDSTEAYDRGEKFAHYRRIPALQEYVLVSQHEPRIEVWHRNERGRWELAQEAGPGEVATLASIGGGLAVDEVYVDPLATNV